MFFYDLLTGRMAGFKFALSDGVMPLSTDSKHFFQNQKKDRMPEKLSDASSHLPSKPVIIFPKAREKI